MKDRLDKEIICWGWLAGIIDGEGYVNPMYREVRIEGKRISCKEFPLIEIVSTDKGIVKGVKELTGIKCRLSKPEPPRQPLYHYIARYSKALEIIRKTAPYIRREDLKRKYEIAFKRYGKPPYPRGTFTFKPCPPK